MLLGHYFIKHYRGHYYAKAQNLSRKLRAAYNPVLGQHDLLLMPTLPLKATPLPPADAPRELYIQRAFEMLANTAPFDATGHPAMSIPCGMGDGLPIGLMLIGRHSTNRQFTVLRRPLKSPATGRRYNDKLAVRPRFRFLEMRVPRAAQHEVVRRSTVAFRSYEFVTILDQQYTASRCTVSGKRKWSFNSSSRLMVASPPEGG